MVVDDKDAAQRALKDVGVTTLDGSFLDFRDPWGNLEIVGYDNIQFDEGAKCPPGHGPRATNENEKAKQSSR